MSPVDVVGSLVTAVAASVEVPWAAALCSIVRTPMTPTRPAQAAVARPAEMILSAVLRRRGRSGPAVWRVLVMVVHPSYGRFLLVIRR